MKKILVILSTLIFLISCSNDDGPKYSFEALPIESIDLPASFTLNESYAIDFTFLRPTDCHAYNGLLFDADEENRTIAVYSKIVPNSNCMDLTEDNIATQSFDFTVLYDQTYKFHIWKGKNSTGEDIYDIIEVPVVTPTE